MASPDVKTIKRLFAVSGNQCAFPTCQIPIVEESSNKIIGKICHIKARSPKGPRYDSEQTEEERHSFENLILLCPFHHDVIDSDVESYSVERLIEIKTVHEKQKINEQKLISDENINLLIDINETVQGSLLSNNNQSGGQMAHQIMNFLLNSDAVTNYEYVEKQRRDKHDFDIFQKADSILNEHKIQSSLGSLGGGHYYYDNFLDDLVDFNYFLRKIENQYLNDNLLEVTHSLIKSFEVLSKFMATHFFDYPRNQTRENTRFCLYPELCIDRAGSGDAKEMALYEKRAEELSVCIDNAWESFINYRKAIKKSLFI